MPTHAPPVLRQQIDGVSSNWGKDTFGVNDHLVREGLLESVKLARHTVGDTHEDIDALFGRLRCYLRGRSWKTKEELMNLIRECLGGEVRRDTIIILNGHFFLFLSLFVPFVCFFVCLFVSPLSVTPKNFFCLTPLLFLVQTTKVFVEEVKDTLDWKAFLRQGGPEEQALDPQLGGFGYSGDTGDEDKGTRRAGHSGYHVLNIKRGSTPGTTTSTFRPYQQPIFNTIAFDSSELPPGTEVSSFPCVLALESTDTEATILLRTPQGFPGLAARVEGWEDDLRSDVNKICLALNGDENADARAWWRSFETNAITTTADAAVLGRVLRKPEDGGMARVPWGATPNQGAAAAVMANAVFRPHLPTVTSSLRGRAEVAAETAAAAGPMANLVVGGWCLATDALL